MAETWLSHTAEAFWDRAGGPGPFPRWIETAVQLALSACVRSLSGLTLRAVERCLERFGVDYRLNSPDRRLRGCLVAYRGRGLLFVDADDPPEEQRFTLAHEAAHFVCDYLKPREHAVTQLGNGVLPVLDRDRAPTALERLDAALARVPLGFHSYLLDRDRADTWRAEDRADRLATELLAPLADVLRRVTADGQRRDPAAQAAHARRILVETFGLPDGIATRYAAWLGDQTARASHFEALLRARPGQRRTSAGSPE